MSGALTAAAGIPLVLVQDEAAASRTRKRAARGSAGQGHQWKQQAGLLVSTIRELRQGSRSHFISPTPNNGGKTKPGNKGYALAFERLLGNVHAGRWRKAVHVPVKVAVARLPSGGYRLSAGHTTSMR